MSGFTQKYTIVHLLGDLPAGYVYSMKDWPLHVTLADVFAIEDEWQEVFEDLKLDLGNHAPLSSRVNGEDLFGEDKSIKVKLLEKTNELQELHEQIVGTLEKHKVIFNSPQYIRAGFRPHSTEQPEGSLSLEDVVEFDSITLIDMFPNDDPYMRKILGTIQFS